MKTHIYKYTFSLLLVFLAIYATYLSYTGYPIYLFPDSMYVSIFAIGLVLLLSLYHTYYPIASKPKTIGVILGLVMVLLPAYTLIDYHDTNIYLRDAMQLVGVLMVILFAAGLIQAPAMAKGEYSNKVEIIEV